MDFPVIVHNETAFRWRSGSRTCGDRDKSLDRAFNSLTNVQGRLHARYPFALANFQNGDRTLRVRADLPARIRHLRAGDPSFSRRHRRPVCRSLRSREPLRHLPVRRAAPWHGRRAKHASLLPRREITQARSVAAAGTQHLRNSSARCREIPPIRADRARPLSSSVSILPNTALYVGGDFGNYETTEALPSFGLRAVWAAHRDCRRSISTDVHYPQGYRRRLQP